MFRGVGGAKKLAAYTYMIIYALFVLACSYFPVFFFLPFSLTFNFSRKPLTDCYFSAASFRWQQMFWAAPWVFFIIIFFFLVRSVKRNLLILPTCMGCVLLARRLAYPFCPFPRVWRIIKNYLKKALLWAKDLAAPEKKNRRKTKYTAKCQRD